MYKKFLKKRNLFKIEGKGGLDPFYLPDPTCGVDIRLSPTIRYKLQPNHTKIKRTCSIWSPSNLVSFIYGALDFWVLSFNRIHLRPIYLWVRINLVHNIFHSFKNVYFSQVDEDGSGRPAR